ncbi:MAG TPA: hypothetical protein EYN89_05220, partial [Flavobacteriales bacterium]|nr:hypothetical protein [Flavobacteriales bacterium]
MERSKVYYLLLVAIMLQVLPVLAKDGGIKFTENKGQWAEQVKYRAGLPGGVLFLEQSTFTYKFILPADITQLKEHHKKGEEAPLNMLLHYHAFKLSFENANTETRTFIEEDPYTSYTNYYIGKDQSKWANQVRSYGTIRYRDLYPGIDLAIYGGGGLKYDFIVEPGSPPSDIRMKYEGADALSIKEGALHISTSVNELVESKPYAYQVIDGKQVEVACNFYLAGNEVSFQFPQGYDNAKTLIIDPSVIFSTFSGSTEKVYGSTGTYDQLGNGYCAGESLGHTINEYPATTGAFSSTVFGGRDIVISKYDPTGQNLLYATYLGGATHEKSIKMVVAPNLDFFILGHTSSADFPITLGAYDTTFNGADDLVISKFDQTGSLLASTYIGGGGSEPSLSIFLSIYDADGDIALDAANNCVVTSSTSSTDFPTTPGVINTSLTDTSDAVVFKLTNDLDTLLLSSFVGGNAGERASSIIIDRSGNYYICGATTSTNLPGVGMGALQDTFQGGTRDGFILRLKGDLSTVLAGTYIGTSGSDHASIIDQDTSQNIYVTGESAGYPVSPGTTSWPLSKPFIQKLDSALSIDYYSTIFGGIGGTISAFNVDTFERVYVSIHGPLDNNLPLTCDAFPYSPLNMDDGFYFIVFSKDATDLAFATYFGPSDDWTGVDVHSYSDFTKEGILYQAMCTDDPGPTFPTTSGAFSTFNLTGAWDMVMTKIDLRPTQVVASMSEIAFSGCAPYTPGFTNESIGSDYYWDFGNGDTSTQVSPAYTYPDSGTFNGMLIATDSSSCNVKDTVFFTVDVLALAVDAGPDDSICNGDSMVLTASSGATAFLWSTGETTAS